MSEEIATAAADLATVELLRARLRACSLRVGELSTTTGYQDAMLAQLRSASIDLVNQLALLTMDDESYLWRIGGRPLDDAYTALRRAVAETTKTK